MNGIRRLESNIIKLYIIKLAKWFSLIMPVVALYYTENGLDTFDIYILQAIYSLSVAVLEIPSGYMADVIGRKRSLIMGSILGTVGYVIYSFSYGFWGFALAEIILGLGGSFISGSDSALLYDTLVAMRKRNKYLRLEGRITSLGNFAETSAALLGGLFAGWISYRFVYFSQSLIAFAAIPASLLLIEPDRIKLKLKPGLWQILEISRYALFQKKILSSAIVISSVIGTATLCMAWTAQVYFVHHGFTETQITPLWIGLNLLVALSSLWVEWVIARMGFRNSLLSIIIFIPLGYLWISILPLSIAIATMFLFYLVRGYATPVLKDLINNNCSSDIRATVLSIRSLLIRISFSVIGPFIGYMSGRFDLRAALFSVFIIFAISAFVAGVFYLRQEKKTK